jgi:hypothetical protein
MISPATPSRSCSAMRAFGVELDAGGTDLLGGLAGRCQQAHGNGRADAVDHEDIAHLVVVLHARRPVLVLLVDAVHVGAGRLGDVGVGGEDGLVHASS